MTQDEAIALESCPQCGGPIMKVHSTGLVSCLDCIGFGPCTWYVRVRPFENESKRERLTRKEQKMKDLQEEIHRRIEEWT